MSKPTAIHDEDPQALKDDLPIDPPHVPLTERENKRICHKTDRTTLVVLMWVYFLQILDKTVLGYGATYGMETDTGLTGDEYSLVGSIAPIAQLCWQPFSSYLIVKVPPKILMPILCLGWGIAQACMAACHNFSELMAARFFLGLFEAGCLPLFGIITSQWYLRSEQPVRIAAWYSTNGLATIVAAALSYGLAHIKSDVLESWQIIFLFVGLVTIVSAPIVYWRLDNDVSTARFLNETEKAQGMERLRANQTGTGNTDFKLSHVYEAVLEPKTYLWIGMAMLLNIVSHQSLDNAFWSYAVYRDPDRQLAGSKARLKGAILASFVLPVIAGLAILYAVPRTTANQGALLAGYYLLAFLFGGNPLIVTWIVGNTAGSTKKSVAMSLFNAATSSGNIVGPLLFTSKDAPSYHPGLRACLGIFCALACVVLVQWGNLWFLNKQQARRRVRNGKSAIIIDHSMQAHFRGVEEGDVDGVTHAGTHAAEEDMTDRQNDEFVYLY
ncbi:hypothetical protein N7454_002904 [Penicillium verhagenii]|nr:hypothetical protein N7454_002904 [Penicillium verhagenii]